jgi:serine/threonine protein phosphatase PrpC
MLRHCAARESVLVKCAWVGDSRAVLLHPKGGSMDLSHDHRVSGPRRPGLSLFERSPHPSWLRPDR